MFCTVKNSAIGAIPQYSQLLLYRTVVGTKILSLVYKKAGISEYQTIQNKFWASGMCANSGITESGIRVIDCAQ